MFSLDILRASSCVNILYDGHYIISTSGCTHGEFSNNDTISSLIQINSSSLIPFKLLANSTCEFKLFQACEQLGCIVMDTLHSAHIVEDQCVHAVPETGCNKPRPA